MNEIQQLNQRIEYLESMIHTLVLSDRYRINKLMKFDDGRNIQLGLTTGTKIGTTGGTAGQKIGFFGATPVVQRTGVAVSAAGIHAALVSLGLITA